MAQKPPLDGKLYHGQYGRNQSTTCCILRRRPLRIAGTSYHRYWLTVQPRHRQIRQ
ncbi:hypothetical protein [Thalassomonas sp. RHCl1]|uniref:hypothetical protein n=1 Tax=Thalassomonas sp. RHCl1 TaxID=2995320 RepID=UPI00248B87FC|nr:hypothetical protein [Thalassomonas sp. RHCl1]